ncbi:NADP-dependent oxidoreductase [Microbacterium sp. H37-C3]|uniref:NADP-dependent oxidoreductase n=1 Tax=Microbacterium sp. H37-C3 TaxID=3004354 RepID=UPI0022AED6AB|nr:NADP-dependent oxidoreductase [Microbacterium sp. H37-C3]MCZ4068231.1 NADP-dependent oxidoreductase [Microbacterium sp. H37-C3]
MKKVTEASVVEYEQPGGPEVLRLVKRPLPAPEAGEVTVEVITMGLNHIDGFVRSGAEKEWDDPYPRRSGSCFAGTVIAAGPGTSGFPVGTDVVGHLRSGAHASHVTVAVERLVRKPRGVTFETAGGLYLAGTTALDILDELKIDADDTVVISAAAGGVGSIEAQIAMHRGARVIGTCGERNFDYLRQLGVKPVRYGEGIVERIRALAPGGVTAFIDNFGQDGREVAETLGVPAGRFRSSADRRDREVALLSDSPDAVAHGTTQLRKVVELAEKRVVSPLVSGFYPLADVAEAYDDLQRLHSRGKVVLATHPVNPRRIGKAREVIES